MKIRLINNWFSSLITLIFGYDAVTIYPFIFVCEGQLTVNLLAHELVHVVQVKNIGWFKFYIKYLYYHFKYGHGKNPYEIEARNKWRQLKPSAILLYDNFKRKKS